MRRSEGYDILRCASPLAARTRIDTDAAVRFPTYLNYLALYHSPTDPTRALPTQYAASLNRPLSLIFEAMQELSSKAAIWGVGRRLDFVV